MLPLEKSNSLTDDGATLSFFGNDCDCKLEKSIHHVGLMMDSKYTMWHAPRSGRKVGKESFKDWPEQACPTVIRFE